MKSFIALFFVLLPMTATAGGSDEPVVIESINITGGIDYDLVVIPQPSNDAPGYEDPYMGSCSKFTVHGTYSWFHSLNFGPNVTRKNHLAALAYLKQAQEIGRIVKLGWIGYGFVPVDPAMPCIVRSRALELTNENAVFSYHGKD